MNESHQTGSQWKNTFNNNGPLPKKRPFKDERPDGHGFPFEGGNEDPGGGAYIPSRPKPKKPFPRIIYMEAGA